MADALNTLTLGPEHTIVQNIVYALPARACYIFSNTALEISNVTAFTTSQTVALNTPTVANGGFVRCTTGAAILHCKAM